MRQRASFAVVAMLSAVAVAGCATGQTGAPASVEPEAARVLGNVVSDTGGDVEYWVQYGTTEALGLETAHATITVPQNTPTGVSVRISGLARSTLYHYRLCAQDSQQQDGPGCGEQRTFTTQAIGCGETVTTDVRLTGDLSCTPFDGASGVGLVVGADGVDIDLDGHSLIGPVFTGGGGPDGIDNTGGFDDVTVRNGSLTQWGDAIHLQGASRNLIRNVDIPTRDTGVVVAGGEQNEIRSSSIQGRNRGILVFASNRVVVAGNHLVGAFGDAILAGTDDSRFARNVVDGSDLGSFARGLALSGARNRVIGNEVFGFGSGNIVLTGGSDNVIAENVARDAPLSGGGTPVDGISIGAQAVRTRVRTNTANGNSGDGIDIAASGTRVRDNTANDNGGLGIDAVPGVIDLGGNSASGNGDPLQCRNVFCQ
jgi:parallel beta-helix repeat protein